MADWPTIASLATAGGTLVLAGATFAAVRSANRAARTAERSLLAGLRPLLLASRPQDPPEKVTWADEHFTKVLGGRGVIEETGGVIYMAASLRNAGAGIAVLHSWHLLFGPDFMQPPDPADFRRLSRDLYIPAGDNGFWQGAIRDPDDPDRRRLLDTIERPDRIAIDVLYGDHEGGQRTVTRFSLNPIADGWLCAAVRFWHLDRDEPR
jgi:hypothetical protein